VDVERKGVINVNENNNNIAEIKVKVDDPFIYFLAEPNMVFVYHIETPQYVTMSDFMDGLHKFETFEISHAADFKAFDHRESQLIEGRGFFINQDGMNEMIEEINKHIQKNRQVKGLENQSDTVHLVTSESAAGSLRVGLGGSKTVIGFPDSFSIGPLWKLDEKVGRSYRKEWLFENINYGLDDYESDNEISNTLREIEDISDHTPIYIWYGNNADEQTALRFYLYLLRDKTNEIFLVNSTELFERYSTTGEEPPVFHTSQMDSEILKTFFKNEKENYLLTPKEASEQLGVSKVTLNKYIQQGLECIDTTSHKKIPTYVIEIWRDSVYAIRLQMIAQEKKRRNQTPTERLHEINNELTELQIKYKSATYQEAFHAFDGDSMDDPSDYYTWRDLEEEKKEIIDVIGGQSLGKKKH